ncbi:MAG: hypothetical protein WD830_06430 [Chloroflexota bacterium]
MFAGCRPAVATQSATGVVISADGPDAAQVDHFNLRTNAGQVMTFTVGRLDLASGGLPAPHLREHLVSGVPITVYYLVEDGENVASRYIDAPP